MAQARPQGYTSSPTRTEKASTATCARSLAYQQTMSSIFVVNGRRAASIILASAVWQSAARLLMRPTSSTLWLKLEAADAVGCSLRSTTQIEQIGWYEEFGGMSHKYKARHAVIVQIETKPPSAVAQPHTPGQMHPAANSGHLTGPAAGAAAGPATAGPAAGHGCAAPPLQPRSGTGGSAQLQKGITVACKQQSPAALKNGLLPAVNADLNAAVLAAVDQYAVRDEQGRPYWLRGRKPSASLMPGADNTSCYLQEGVQLHARWPLPPI